MSINLYFFDRKKKEHVDFPIQTPTQLTRQMLKAGTREQKKAMLQAHLTQEGWSKKEQQWVLTSFDEKIKNQDLDLRAM